MRNRFTNVRRGLALAVLFATGSLAAQAQNVGIGTTAPNASALLDLTSTAKGALLPRMTSAQRATIATPATGLVVFQTDGTTPGFYYNAGTPAAPNWVLLGAGDNLGNHTATQALSLAGNALVGTGATLGTTVGLGVRADGGLNIGQNTGGNLFLGYLSGNATLTGSNNVFTGVQSGTAITTGNNNLFSGYQSGFSNTTGANNQFIGFQAGYANTTGGSNVFSGVNSGFSNTTGNNNLFSGNGSGFSNTTGSGNLFSGNNSGYYNTTGTNNLFSGIGSGYNNTTGNYNLFSGYQSGFSNITASYNVFSGYQSGYSNATGSNNVFSGYNSGYYNSTGHDNLFLGSASGQNNTTGNFNLFSGNSSGYSNTTASYNLFSGYQSGYNNTTGNLNLFSGVSSGFANTTGSSNMFSGVSSGQYNTTGSNNTAVGYLAGPASGSVALTNTTALGNGATVTASNTIQLGDANITTLNCKVGLTTPSDMRFKYQVQANVPGLAFITRLRPVTYRFDQAKMAAFLNTGELPAGFTPDPAAAVQTGFLAQQVEQAAQAVGYPFDGVHAPANAREHYSLIYSQFVVPLVQAVQEQQAQIEALKAQNAALQGSSAGDHASLLTMQAQMARLLGADAQAHR